MSVASNNTQNGTQDPYEQVNSNNTTNRRVVIRQKTGAANRFLHLGINAGRLNWTTEGETHGHAAASGGYGVASSPAFSSDNFPPLLNTGPYPSTFTSTNRVEISSSDGPRRIFFQGNGAAITPGNFSSTGGQVLQQPVIAAADGVQITGVGGLPSPFFGTGAAASHAAAIAALLKSANPGFTQAQIKTALTATAVDIEIAGTDRDAGFGIVMPYPALLSLGVTGKAFLETGVATATETCCNANGLIERGETASLNLTLNNPGVLNATAITTTLTTDHAGYRDFERLVRLCRLGGDFRVGSQHVTVFLPAEPFGGGRCDGGLCATVNYTGGWNASQVLPF